MIELEKDPRFQLAFNTLQLLDDPAGKLLTASAGGRRAAGVVGRARFAAGRVCDPALGANMQRAKGRVTAPPYFKTPARRGAVTPRGTA